MTDRRAVAALVWVLAGGCVTRCLAAEQPAPIQSKAYFVAINGDDAGNGSAAKPFATVQRAIRAMRAGGTKTTYVRKGTYPISSPLVFTPADKGETILNYPAEVPTLAGARAGLASIIRLQGSTNITLSGLTLSGAGNSGAILLIHARHNTIRDNDLVGNGNALEVTSGSSGNVISGNHISASVKNAIEVKDRSNANTFQNNSINGTGGVGTSASGFLLHGVSDNTISHNRVENTAGIGIGIENWDAKTVNIGNIVEFNDVRHVNTSPRSIDSGAIYVLGRSQVDTRTVIRCNRVNGTGASHPAHTVGIYLDDLTSGVTVQDNIVTGVGSDAVQIHGGKNNSILNNILDTGRGRASAILFQAAPLDTHPRIAMTGNVVTGNIIYSSSPKPVVFVNYKGGKPLVAGNLYFNTTGVTMRGADLSGDPQPEFGDPAFADPAAGDYTIAKQSAAASIGFQAIDQHAIGPTSDTQAGGSSEACQ